jgi:hypothetical protein
VSERLLGRWSYLEPVGNVRIETTDLSNAIIENIDGLARLENGLRMQVLALAQRILVSCCSPTCCGHCCIGAARKDIPPWLDTLAYPLRLICATTKTKTGRYE